MNIYTSVEQCALPASGACVTIGNFDGVHAGHRALIARMRAKAAEGGLASVVITFWPHPRVVLAGKHAPASLSTQAERRALLAETGTDILLELPFTTALAALTPEDFVWKMLLPLPTKELVIGYDFSLGRGRAGNYEVLRALGQRYGFGVERLQPVYVGEVIASSTAVRDAVFNGSMDKAAALLGRPYSLSGEVIHGCGRGHGLGFPTANLAMPDVLLPRRGVYATRVRCGGETWKAVTNIGSNPTFDGGRLSIESFLLDGDVNLYGKEITVQFIGRLRDEQKFASPEMLTARIAVDVAEARRILAAVRAA